MLSELNLVKVKSALPFLDEASPEMMGELVRQTHIQKIPSGSMVFWEGDACQSLALLLSGRVRVYKIGENGREITLYRFGTGEGCILTASCIMQDGGFPALARVEEHAEALLVPANALKDWVQRYAIWSAFVLGLLSRRLADVITTIEEIAFKRMDERLMEWMIKNRPPNGNVINTTHQHIAEELGTAREVVSRLLKEFEVEHKIELARGEIKIINSDWI